MIIIFKTNLDAYRDVRWPELDNIPPKGAYVQPGKVYVDYLVSKNLPTRLEVVGHTIKEIEYYNEKNIVSRKTVCEVELWYNKTDYDLYTLSGHKLM